MDTPSNINGKVRRLYPGEAIPYDLLLLADETEAAINRYIYDSDVYVYEAQNEIIAIYVLQVTGSDEIEIKNIAVEKRHQNLSIGKLLLRDAEIKAKEKGFGSIIIGTGDASIKQLYIYQKAGFEVFDIKKNFYIDNYPEPIFENGIQLKHMLVLKKKIR
ncbi:GNAT family N-acetyltransferase [Negadavirga shengliensis]|uniref:GNAT family N-acetyltransferase n=1 Tax=Negadavirga shengliensis TaxID=1389218 RepID=A0ABV9T5K0_9BACT